VKPEQLARDLKCMVGDRATVSRHERWFYERDLLNLPPWLAGLVRVTPEAVVAPTNTREVSALLKYCDDNRIPAVPRGAASSGLFGAVPKRGGVVFDLRHCGTDADVVVNGDVVSCPAGMTWWELNRRLTLVGRTLKSYPSSARSATLAGWIMTTGLGIGNIGHGPVRNQVRSAEVVFADGRVVEYDAGTDLDVVVGSEGLLGIMTRVSLETRALPERSSHHLVHFGRIGPLFEFIQALMRRSPLPYSVELFDGAYLNMLKTAGYRLAGASPGSGAALVSYDGAPDEVDEGSYVLRTVLASFGGEARDGGEEEWRQRFNMLRVKRAGPALVLGSVHLPLASLASFYGRMVRLRKRPVGLLGHVFSRDDCVLMPMIATDEDRRLEYTLALQTPVALSNLALSLGGGPGGGLGLWNAVYRGSPLLRQKASVIRARKKELDPHGIMNPGMWLDPPWLLRPMAFTAAVTVASLADRVLPGPPAHACAELPSGGLSPLAATEFGDCVQCGYCAGYCPTRQRWVSSTPRGRILAARALVGPALKAGTRLQPEVVRDVFECTLCGRCRVDCSVGVKSPEMWADLRCRLVEAGAGLQTLNNLSRTIEETHNLAAKPNEQRGRWADRLNLAHRRDSAETVFFVGCVTSFYPMVQDVARSFAQILDHTGTDFAVLGGEEWCCGYPLLSAGWGVAAVQHIEHNIAKMKQTGARRIVTACTGCYRMWKHDYPRITGRDVPFEVMHSTEVIAGLLEQGKMSLGETKSTVTYHDPCDLGRNAGMYDLPRRIISQIPGIEFIELEFNREYCNCCGSGGDLLASNQALSLEIAARKIDEIIRTGAESVVTACPSCVRAMTMAKLAQKSPLRVMDISQLVWSAVAGKTVRPKIP
jgi:heterodisulfide reductase subunit D